MTTLADRPGERLEQLWAEEPGLGTWLSTVDHKRLAKKYLYTALVFLVLGGIEASVMRLQLAHSNLKLLDPETYNQLFTMHGVTMIFLFAVPIFSGFGVYMVPLMIGSREMAFPRLNAFTYWGFVAAGVFMYSSFLIGRSPDGGWFGYTPLTDKAFSPGPNIDFYALGLIFLGLASTGAAINFITTILNVRAPADGRLHVGRPRRDGDRVHRVRRVGAPHVLDGSAVLGAQLRFVDELPRRDPIGDPGLRVPGDLGDGETEADDADVVRAGFHLDLRDRRREWGDDRLGAARPSRHRLLLRRRALPLHHGRRRAVPDARCALLLGPEDMGPETGRALGQDLVLADVHRLQPRLLPDAHPRRDRDAAPNVHVRV